MLLTLKLVTERLTRCDPSWVPLIVTSAPCGHRNTFKNVLFGQFYISCLGAVSEALIKSRSPRTL